MATVTLFKNVPWGTDGLNVIRFPSETAQLAYFESLNGVTRDVNYSPRPGAVLQLSDEFADASEYNYCIWEGDKGERRFFFITGFEYLNDYPTVAYAIEPDIWQNCHLKMQINPCTIHRRHMPRWSGDDPNYPLLYPVDEGNPRSYDSTALWRLNFPSNIVPVMFVTQKYVTGTNGLTQYVSFVKTDGSNVEGPNHNWLNPFTASFGTDLTSTGLAPSDIIGCYVLPFLPDSQYTISGNTVTVNTSPSGIFAYPNTPDATVNIASFAGQKLFTITKNINVSFPKPQKGTSANTASFLYEPQAFSDNLRTIAITDFNGNIVTTIPKNLAWENTMITLKGEYQTMNPNLRIGITSGKVSNGTQFVISLPAIDVPQSPWADYIVRDRTADRQILENSIKANYYNSLASGLTGGVIAGSVGWGTNAMYYPKRSAASGAAIGAGAGAISLAGSLASAYIRDKTDRDNFALNEQKIKNSSAPPIGGNNFVSMLGNNISVVEQVADDLSYQIIANNYIANGVIVDSFGEVPLRTRYYYDFIQTKNCSISGNVNNEDREFLEAMFNTGITVWHSETFRGFKYDRNNIEV